MKIYDYIIYGGGPTGMTLAYLLAKNNYSVGLIEKESQLGGCWKVEWQDNKYFTEHSPRVIMDNDSSFFRLLNQIGFDYYNETVSTYGSLFQTNKKIINFFYKNLQFLDYLKILNGYFNSNNLTVTEWLEKYNISNSGKKAFTVFSLLLANSPDKLLINEIFGINNFPTMFLQFKDNQKWINLLEKELINLKVNILKNYSLDYLIYDMTSNKISYAIVSHQKEWKGKAQQFIYSKNHLITFPPKAMSNFLENQIDIIRNNWDELSGNKLNKWLNDSTYHSFGFQLHFYKEQTINEEWCWTCMNDYNLIMLPTSNYQTTFSKDENIKAVWSFTIVDTSVFIKRLNKTVDQMNKNEIVSDIINLLKIKPDKITFYDGLHKENNKWISKDSAFSLGKSGIVKNKGKLNNLFWIGPHNKKGITVINKAVNIAVEWVKNNKNKTFNLDKTRNFTFEITLIILFLIIIYSYKNHIYV